MTKQEIIQRFKYRLQGSSKLKKSVVDTIQLLTDKQIKYVTKYCWFVGSMEDAWAFTLKGNDLSSKEYLIFLSDELLKENDDQIRYTILHEVGHVLLGHRNAILERQSKVEIRKQEREADKFASRLASVKK